ncbi:uncharacterized protein NPIL_183201 [Nephila pilipes]|uniref:Uncharacterized protein n=1 Tax=Nephila pilipes TaxID=299642 RepID=A0A8X6P357_NEPPI|nr:uncharacterized protein NPIL_183201 [Nephila pilipes]
MYHVKRSKPIECLVENPKADRLIGMVESVIAARGQHTGLEEKAGRINLSLDIYIWNEWSLKLLCRLELVVDKEIKDKILELAVYCLQKKRGCKKTLILKELETHLESCGYVPVSCPCSCGLQVTKRELAQHLTSTCDRRLVSCPFCQEDVVFKDMDGHNDVCGKRPVTCPHCKAEVKREQNLELKVEESVSENLKLKEQLQDIYPVLGTVKSLDKTVTSLLEKVKKLEIAEQTVEEMNETLIRLREYMQRTQPAVVQDHKSKSPQGTKSPESKSPPRGLFNHNTSFEDHKPKHAAPPTDL